MSLDYDLRAVKDRDMSVEGWNVTESIVWATIPVGLGEITELNYKEFYARYVITYRLLGAEPYFDVMELKEHIGLKTNVISETRKQWLKRFSNVVNTQTNQVIQQLEQEDFRKERRKRNDT